MALSGTRTFVGFGFGAIQSGLFLHEAFHSGNFKRLVVAEVIPDVIASVRQNKNQFAVNIADKDHWSTSTIGPIEILDPNAETESRAIISAIADAEEISTAVPSVTFYTSDKPGSLHRLLAAGLQEKVRRGGPRAVIYTAENHNHAAEILHSAVLGLIPAAEQPAIEAKVQFLNTVIGKMSQVFIDPHEAQKYGLQTVTPVSTRSFLVEAFNRILITRIHFSQPFQRGITVFEEKDDLLPFEEAKLFGHNATHALLGYLGALQGLTSVAEFRKVDSILTFARQAFIEESGEALIRKYHGLDPLFTPAGYTDYADDLLERMTNPFLMDTIERVTRDTERKLGWNDRLVGTVRLGLSQGLTPTHYAAGVAAALARLDPEVLETAKPYINTLETLWGNAVQDQAEKEKVVSLIEEARQQVAAWKQQDYPALASIFTA